MNRKKQIESLKVDVRRLNDEVGCYRTKYTQAYTYNEALKKENAQLQARLDRAIKMLETQNEKFKQQIIQGER